MTEDKSRAYSCTGCAPIAIIMGGFMRIIIAFALLLLGSIIIGCDKEIKEAVKPAPLQHTNT